MRLRLATVLAYEGGRLLDRSSTVHQLGNELGTAFAAMAVVAALLSARTTGEGAWIDLSCWDALVESHRTEIAMTKRLKRPFTLHGRPRQALYDTYLSSDGVPVLLGALEHKFWKRFCEQIGRGRTSSAATPARRSSSAMTTTACARSARRSSRRPPPRSGWSGSSPGTCQAGRSSRSPRSWRPTTSRRGGSPRARTVPGRTSPPRSAGITPASAPGRGSRRRRAFDENREEILRDWLG